MLKLLFFALLGLTLSVADIPRHCFSPPELTFRAFQFDHEYTTFNRFKAEYDVRDRRVAFLEEEVKGPAPGKQYLWLMFLHEEKAGFEFNLKTKKCKKFNPGKFHHFGTPEGSKFEADFYVGGPGESIDAEMWSDRTDFKREDWLGVFTKRNCYPIRTFTRNTHNNHTLTTNINDLVEGIEDPGLFDPPKECLQQGVLEEEMSETARRMYSIYSRTLL
ncbi:mammalian ependymin-related protein 1 [Aplysia californica]|uniref:Mammalian ependymin-related protein 1 n=1 Tax=Aplysia californica TaxID=6500 RepID=A0ABM0JRK2_APLCA|nr:mammalian ependymin-related protein 1 [Aplysia californica]